MKKKRLPPACCHPCFDVASSLSASSSSSRRRQREGRGRGRKEGPSSSPSQLQRAGTRSRDPSCTVETCGLRKMGSSNSPDEGGGFRVESSRFGCPFE